MNGERTDEQGQSEIFITKELLVKGFRKIEDVHTEVGIFQVRPLMDGEKAKIDALSVRGIKASGKREDIQNMDINLDMEQVITNDWDIRFLIMSCGLSIEKGKPITVGDLKGASLSDAVVKKVVGEIRRISGMSDPTVVNAALRRFRGEPTGPAANNPDNIGGDAASDNR